jgi:hypothetical protein
MLREVRHLQVISLGLFRFVHACRLVSPSTRTCAVGEGDYCAASNVTNSSSVFTVRDLGTPTFRIFSAEFYINLCLLRDHNPT